MGISKFLRHESCSVCGSKDNLSVWYNQELKGETYFCYTKGCKNKKTDVQLAKELGIKDYQPKDDEPSFIPGSFLLPDLEFVSLERRKLPQKALEKYGIGIDPTARLTFPYEVPEWGLVAAKVTPGYRNQKYSIVGASDLLGFFGQQFIPNKHSVILTEGELDAVAAFVLTGFTAWSIPHGAKGASEFIREHLTDLESFDSIYVCFDNDEVGNKAAREVMEVLSPGKGKLVILPKYPMDDGKTTKDACDFTTTGRKHEFLEAINSAKFRQVRSYYNSEELLSVVKNRIYNPELSKGVTTGIHQLDDSLKGGWRMKELTLLIAGVLQGKSTLGRWFLTKQILANQKCMYLPLEDGADLGVTRILEMMNRVKLLLDTDSVIDEDTLEIYFNAMIGNLIVPKNDHLKTWDKVREAIEYGIRSHNVKFVLLDHLMFVPGMRSGYKVADNVANVLNELKRLANLGAHIWVINHITRDASDKDGNDPSIVRGYGGSANEQSVDNLITLSRDRDGDEVIVNVEKVRIYGKRSSFSLQYKDVGYEETRTLFRAKRSKDKQDNEPTANQTKKTNRQQLRGQHSRKQQTTNSDTIQEETRNVQNNENDRNESRFHARKLICRGEGVEQKRSGMVKKHSSATTTKSKFTNPLPCVTSE